jgi:hypothetical protein
MIGASCLLSDRRGDFLFARGDEQVAERAPAEKREHAQAAAWSD